MPKIAILSDFPNTISMEEAKLHKENGPSISYRDGWSIYSLFGVSVPKEWIDNKPTAKEILACKNAEQRMVGMRYIGLQNFLGELDHKVIDTKDDYRLLLIDLEGRQCEFLEMLNPSTGETHIEGVNPGITSVNQALAWRNNMELYITPKILT